MLKKVFPILALSMFSSILGIGIIVPFLSLYAKDMGATGVWLGIMFAGYGIANTIANPIAGRLSDRRGRKLFLAIGLLTYSLSSLGYIWAGSVSQLALVRVIQGAAGGMIFPIALAYVGDISPEGEEGRWMGYANAAFFSGFGFGPLIGGVLTEHFGMNVAFSTMGGLNLLAFLIVTLFLPEISQRKMSTNSRLSFREMSTSGIIRGIFSFRLTQAIGRGGFMVFLPIFAGIYLDLSPTLIGILIAVHVLLMSAASPPGGHIADRFSRRTLVVLGNFIFLIPLALIPLAHSFWQLLWLCVFQGIGGAISMPAASALIVEEGRKFGMGSTMSMLIVAMSIGMTIGPLISGGIADAVNINSVFYFGGGVGLIGTGLFIWFTR